MCILVSVEIITLNSDVDFFLRPNNRYARLRVTEFNREQCAMFQLIWSLRCITSDHKLVVIAYYLLILPRKQWERIYCVVNKIYFNSVT